MEPDDSVSQATLERSLIDLAVESWRFARTFDRLLRRLDAGESSRFASRCRYFQKQINNKLEYSGIRLVNLEGELFDPGMAAAPVNITDFDPDDELVVEQMLEPVVMGHQCVLRTGTVKLRKA